MRKKLRISKLPLFICTTFAFINTTAGFSQDTQANFVVEDQEEAFLIRRIAEFWKDQDFSLVKSQIEDFISSHPYSKINDQLKGVLGDLYLQEKQYEKALSIYNEISDRDIIEKTIINKLQCYYELNQFDSISKEGEPFLYSDKAEILDRKMELHFLVAESLLRESLDATNQDEKKRIASQARELYETLLDSPFKEHSEFALAEIYTIIEEHNLAAQLYQNLARGQKDKKEELLFHAATSQAQYDRQQAIKTFTDVIALKGSKKHQAEYNRLVLFFQEEAFEDVLKNKDEVALHVDNENRSTLDYMIGRSYFAAGEFGNAKNFLSKYLSFDEKDNSHYKNSLLMLLTCAQKLKEDQLFDDTISQLKTHYKEADELKQALLIHAMMLKAKGDTEGAQKELEHIIQNHRDFEDQETLNLEYGLITHDNGQWQTSYSTLKNYLQSYPEGKQRNVAWKYFLSSCLNYLKANEEKNYAYSKIEFFADISEVLNEQDKNHEILTADEEKECRLLYAKTAYELDKYNESLASLNDYVDSYANDPSLGEAHFLIGLCHQKIGSDPEQFYVHTEKAIQINPELNELSSVHLQLYNAYLSKAQESLGLDENTQPLFEKAAEHLYFAVAKNDTEIKLQNRLWLANHYYQKVKAQNLTKDNENFVRALSLYNQALVIEGTQNIVAIDQESLYLEPEVLKYSELLSKTDSSQLKINLLKDLVSQQHQNERYDWKLKRQTLLELAKSYESAKLERDALETYSFITKQFPSRSSYTVDYAKLHLARLRYKLDQLDQRNNQQSTAEVLSLLKDLQIKKTVDSEPLHIEAAIDYAKLRASLADENEKESRYAFFLSRLKQDFESENDPIAVQYQESLKDSPAKKDLYDLYMAFVDAEMVRLTAKMEHKNNRLSQAEELNSQALEKLSAISKNAIATDYLKEHVKQSIHAIDNINSY